MGKQKRTSTVRRRTRQRLFEAQSGLCFWCKRDMVLQPAQQALRTAATFDELIPQALGGTGNLRNVVLACPPCNQRRGATMAPLWAFAIVAQRPEPWRDDETYKAQQQGITTCP